MAVVLRFPRHARASIGTAAAARASKVILEQPFSPAKRTTSGQRRGGIPLTRQVLIVFNGTPKASATAPVPPRASIASPAVIMPPNIVRDLRTSQAFASCEATFVPCCAALLPMAESVKDIARRLVETREALGFQSQVDFCREIGVEKNVYNPFEKGKRRITIDVALKIRRRFGIPIDWVFCGDPAALPANIYRKLGRSAA